jgi:glycosyltransferase involved in cell wall biosynthesis
MSDVDLSICIATFNRGGFIGATLRSIVPQLDGAVEVVIVDGASTDDTRDRVDEFAARCPNVRYFREASNSGIDQDFDKAVSYAAGRYVWLMTDDDLMIDGAVARVRAALDERDLVVVNSQVRTADMSKVLCERMIPIERDVDYERADRERCFVDVARGLTFIGSVIVRRDAWLARQRTPYYGSLFVHVGVIFQTPALERVRVLAEPVLQIRYGVAMWTPRSFDVWMYKWPDLIWSFGDFSDAAKAHVTRREPWRSPMKLFHFRSKNAYSIDQYRKHLAGRATGPYGAVASLIGVFPAFVANLASIAYVSVTSRHNRIPLYDLVNANRWPALRRLMLRAFRL